MGAALIIGMALLSILPSFLIATLWLKQKGIKPDNNGTIQTFMANAPGPLKGGLIALNFTMLGLLIWLGMKILAMMDG